MENKLRDRVRLYCDYMNIRVSQFEKKAGLSNGYFNQVSKKPSDAKLDTIAKAHPELSIEWLCTGRGEMINKFVDEAPTLPRPTEVREDMPITDEALVAELRSQIEKLEAKVDNLNRELGEKSALINILRQGSLESI